VLLHRSLPDVPKKADVQAALSVLPAADVPGRCCMLHVAYWQPCRGCLTRRASSLKSASRFQQSGTAGNPSLLGFWINLTAAPPPRWRPQRCVTPIVTRGPSPCRVQQAQAGHFAGSSWAAALDSFHGRGTLTPPGAAGAGAQSRAPARRTSAAVRGPPTCRRPPAPATRGRQAVSIPDSVQRSVRRLRESSHSCRWWSLTSHHHAKRLVSAWNATAARASAIGMKSFVAWQQSQELSRANATKQSSMQEHRFDKASHAE
jgi:hypothetical protein